MRKYKCKCQICGKTSTTDVAYKVTKGTKKFYYCSEEEYNTMKKQSENRDNCYYTVARIIKVPMLSPAMKKEINHLSEHYEFIVIEKTFKEKKEVIQRFLAKDTTYSEFSRMKYIMTIIKNHINDVYSKYTEEQKRKAELFTKSQQQTIDIDILNNTLDNPQPVQKAPQVMPTTGRNRVRDISAWL